jgi:hypothetical protein
MKYRWNKLKEKILMFIVWRLPRSMIMWSVIRCWAYATTGEHSDKRLNEVTWEMALKAWEK